MKLNEYLKEFGVKKAIFCKRVGISLGTLDNILDFKTDIRLSIALRIVEETRGLVSAKELLPKEIPQEKSKNKSQKKAN